MTDANPKPIYRIADLHESDRPRERLANLGAQALTNAELIAILLRVGVVGESAVDVGQRLLKKFGGISGLHRASIKELMLRTECGKNRVRFGHEQRILGTIHRLFAQHVWTRHGDRFIDDGEWTSQSRPDYTLSIRWRVHVERLMAGSQDHSTKGGTGRCSLDFR